MSTRKTTFEVVPLAAIAPFVGDAQILGEPEGSGAQTTAGRILSVTYDESLAATRKMLFSSIGLHVTSALTLEDAIGFCQDELFDLIVVGHSMPMDHRQLMVKELRRCCNAPILALCCPAEPALSEADYIFDSIQSPAALLAAITDILNSKSRPSLDDISNP